MVSLFFFSFRFLFHFFFYIHINYAYNDWFLYFFLCVCVISFHRTVCLLNFMKGKVFICSFVVSSIQVPSCVKRKSDSSSSSSNNKFDDIFTNSHTRCFCSVYECKHTYKPIFLWKLLIITALQPLRFFFSWYL